MPTALEFLQEVGNAASGELFGPTRDDLKSTIAGNTYEYPDVYPGMARTDNCLTRPLMEKRSARTATRCCPNIVTAPFCIKRRLIHLRSIPRYRLMAVGRFPTRPASLTIIISLSGRLPGDWAGLSKRSACTWAKGRLKQWRNRMHRAAKRAARLHQRISCTPRSPPRRYMPFAPRTSRQHPEFRTRATPIWRSHHSVSASTGRGFRWGESPDRCR